MASKLTPEQEQNLVAMQSINIAANALAQCAHLCNVDIETALPMVKALAEKALYKIQNPDLFKQPSP